MTIVYTDHAYPSPKHPTWHAFSKESIHSFARAGHQCIVVSPEVWPRTLDREGFPYCQVEAKYPSGGSVTVYRPSRFSFTARLQFPRLGILNPWRWTFALFCHAVIKTLKKHGVKPDLAIGKFLYFGGGGAIEVGKTFKCPSLIEVGEGLLATADGLGIPFAKRHLLGATYLIPNGSHLARRLIPKFSLPPEKVVAIPNGVDRAVFRPLDKAECRKKFGFPQDKFIVGAVGNFLYLKGIARVAEAIDGMPDVVGVYAGSGPLPPKGGNVFFADRVLHEDLPAFYSACDIFVLPTLSEGCCNAIEEALSCGLPVVGSVGEHLDDLLDETCSLRCDPLDIAALRAAVQKLKVDASLRERLSTGAITKANTLTCEERVKALLSLAAKTDVFPEDVLEMV